LTSGFRAINWPAAAFILSRVLFRLAADLAGLIIALCPLLRRADPRAGCFPDTRQSCQVDT